MKEYAFDVVLLAAIRVKAADEASAVALLRASLDCADSNMGAWPNGDPILAEVSLDPTVPPQLYEIDGGAV